jgi:hypothetical protein
MLPSLHQVRINGRGGTVHQRKHCALTVPKEPQQYLQLRISRGGVGKVVGIVFWGKQYINKIGEVQKKLIM